MKILIITSKVFYNQIPAIEEVLKKAGHEIFMPNCFDNSKAEFEAKVLGEEAHRKFKAKMFHQSEEIISKMDAVLVLNYDKNDMKNYIGGAVLLEMYDAFRMGKKIFLMNDVPENMLKDEIVGMSPIVISGNLDLVK